MVLDHILKTNPIMEPRQRQRGLLFLRPVTGNPQATRRHRTRDKPHDSKVRHHLMVDIGRSRRKPPKAPPVGTFVWSLAETVVRLPGPGQDGSELSTSQDADRFGAPAKDMTVEVPKPPTQLKAPCLVAPPILHALSVFEKEWGEDQFSAYGFALIMVAGKNAMGSGKNSQTLH